MHEGNTGSYLGFDINAFANSIDVKALVFLVGSIICVLITFGTNRSLHRLLNELLLLLDFDTGNSSSPEPINE